MKKVLFLIIVILLSSCTVNNSITTSAKNNVDENYYKISKEDYGTRFNCKKVDSLMYYNEEPINFTDIKLYEMENNYEFFALIVAKLDISSMSEKEKHYFLEDTTHLDGRITKVFQLRGDFFDAETSLLGPYMQAKSVINNEKTEIIIYMKSNRSKKSISESMVELMAVINQDNNKTDYYEFQLCGFNDNVIDKIYNVDDFPEIKNIFINNFDF